MADVAIKITGDVASAVKGLGKVNTSLLNLNQGLQFLTSVANLAAKAVSSVAGAVGSVIEEGAAFEQGMADLRAVTKLTTTEFDSLSIAAKDIGSTTAFTAIEASGAMEQLARSGFNATKILGSVNEVMDLSTATGTELSRSAQVLATSLNIFADSGLTAKKATDLMVKTVGASPQNFENLANALETSQSTASAFGISFEDLTVILGAMADAGIRGEKAGTALNGAISRLANPTAAVTKTLDKLGIMAKDVNPQFRSFGRILDTLSFSGATSADILKILGQEAGPKFIKMIQKGSGSLREFKKKQDDANTASEAARIKLNTFEGSMLLFESAVSGLKITLFDTFKDVLRPILDFGTQSVGAIKKLIEETEKVEDIFALMGETGEALNDIYKRLNTTMLLMGPTMRKALGASLGFLISGFKELGRLAAFSSEILIELVNDTIRESIKSYNDFRDGILDIVQAYKDVITATKEISKVLKILTQEAFARATDSIDEMFKKVKQFTKPLLDLAKAFFKPNEEAKDFDETLTGNTVSVSLDTVKENSGQLATELKGDLAGAFGIANTLAQRFDDILKSQITNLKKLKFNLLLGAEAIRQFASGEIVGILKSMNAVFSDMSKNVGNFSDSLKSLEGGELKSAIDSTTSSMQFLVNSTRNFVDQLRQALNKANSISRALSSSSSSAGFSSSFSSASPSFSPSFSSSAPAPAPVQSSGVNLIFNIQSIDPRKQSKEIIEIIEQANMTGRLSL